MAPGYRNSNPSRRQTRGLVDHDIFEGLPVRNWRRDAVTVAPPPAHDPFATAKDKWDVELPWGMPKDAHLMPQHSQDLLRAARSGRIYQKRMLVEEEDIEADALLVEKAEKKEEAKEEGFVVRTWKLVPKHLEGPEIEYLAKRRKGLRGAPVKGVATLTKMTLRRTDEAGNTYVEDVVVPEGHVVEGEVIATTVILDPATTGAPVAGVAPPQPVKRRPPPPKRRAKGPGRGRRKKLPLPPRSAPATVGAAQVDGQAAEAPKQEPAVDANGVKIESSVTPAPGNEDTEMGDGSMAQSDDEGEGEGDDRSEGSDDEDQDGEGEGSQTHDQDDDNRMVLDNLPPEPKVQAPKPAISGDFPVEAPHGEFGGQAGGQGPTTSGSPLKHAFTPQSYSPTLSAEGEVENAPADAFGGGQQLQGHFEQQQQQVFHGQDHQQQQHQYPEPQQQHQEHLHEGPAADTPSAFDVSATDFAGMLSGTPPQFGEHQEEGGDDEMLLDSVQGHDEHQLPDLSDFDPHASTEAPGEQGVGGDEGPGEEKFEDLLGSLEDHLNDGSGEGEGPMALIGVEEAEAVVVEAVVDEVAPASVVEEVPAPVVVAEEQKPAEDEKMDEAPAAPALEVVEPASAPAETETASAEAKEAEPAMVADLKEPSASPAKEAESAVPEAPAAVEAEAPSADVAEEPAAPVEVEAPTVVEEAVVETPQVAEALAIVEEVAKAVPEPVAQEEAKEEVKQPTPEKTQDPVPEVVKEVTPEVAAKEEEAVEVAQGETEKKEEQAATEEPSAAA
ncbi:hypothetical protein VE01_02646 [Pseudogymnoascus verrucosus]|uniref:Uncharacterized protein n=1 Tax=Pseudogymnoascus verrucosus TaxID=342668 RepID=A0A1B8GTM4_9PEZI|nr:uncharacterized protein VE01_02646 [Pseudogymnoascus verrucosus]OBT99183.1 hypothetical protein VE01_02646 [Pseudogymnoascus verrucosus]